MYECRPDYSKSNMIQEYTLSLWRRSRATGANMQGTDQITEITKIQSKNDSRAEPTPVKIYEKIIFRKEEWFVFDSADTRPFNHLC